MMAAALAVKIAVVAPELTVTDVGTVKADDRLLESVTLVLLVGAAERVTVQVVDVEAARVVPPHCREETAGAARIVKIWD